MFIMVCIGTEAAANVRRSVDDLEQCVCRLGYVPAHNIYLYTLSYTINLTMLHMYIVCNIVYGVR